MGRKIPGGEGGFAGVGGDEWPNWERDYLLRAARKGGGLRLRGRRKTLALYLGRPIAPWACKEDVRGA